MFTLTYVYFEYENSISRWHIWNEDRTKLIAFPLFQLVTRLNSGNPFEIEIHNEICHINLYMNTGIPIGIFEVSIHENDVFAFI